MPTIGHPLSDWEKCFHLRVDVCHLKHALEGMYILHSALQRHLKIALTLQTGQLLTCHESGRAPAVEIANASPHS